MKKLVLVMVSIFLMALFIAFNYLLWDRENRENTLQALELDNAGKSAEVTLKNNEIKNLQNENDKQQQTIDQLEIDKKQLTTDKTGMSDEISRLKNTISGKNDILNALKQICDPKQLEQPVRKWVDAINAGDYGAAYELEYASLASYGNPPGSPDYGESLKKSIKSINLKSIKLDPDKGNIDGEIILSIELDIKLLEDSDLQTYSDGVNKKSVKIGYDTVKKEFTILQIF